MADIDTQEQEQAMSLRQIARKAAMDQEKDKSRLEKATAPAREWSKGGLRWAWGVTASLIGFIPGLLYINTHAFFRITPLSMFFCELGTEWTPGKTEKLAEGFGLGGVKLGEKMLLAFLDFVLFMIIVLIIIILNFQKLLTNSLKLGYLKISIFSSFSIDILINSIQKLSYVH
jgi:hypothetical protein